MLHKIFHHHPKKNARIAGALAVVALVAGFALGSHARSDGFGFAAKGARYGMHQMPDGTWMPNSGSGHAMDHEMDAMMADLAGKKGEAFELAFLDGMIVHHEGAVDMARALLEETDRPELVKMANDIISVQTDEIDMMKRWRAEWFGR